MERGHQTLFTVLREHSRLNGASPALITVDRTVTYAELFEDARGIAAGLGRKGIGKGDRVCVLAQNSVEYFELLGACAGLGAIVFPLNWRLSPTEIAFAVRLAEPKALVVGPGQIGQLSEVDNGALEVRAVIGQSGAGDFTPLSEMLEAAAAPEFEVGGNEPSMILSTAAVAGVPRGALLSHANLLTAAEQLRTALGLTASDRHLAALPLFHVTGLGLSLATLLAGGANVVTEGFDPPQAARLIDEHRVTLLASFPPVLSLLLDARKAAGAEWNSLRYVLGLDAPEVIRRLLSETQADFWTGYGQSETSGVVTLGSVKERPGSAGRPLPVARLRCVDEADVEVPTGEPGEIVVQGPLVFLGYWRDADATDYAARHGWHHTGDLGKLDEDGYLFYLGRKPEKELIKSGGENVYPAEVERVLMELPEVAAVCVIGVADATWGEAVKAVIELAPGARLTSEQIQEAVARRIAAFKKPRAVEFVERLPRLPDGKVDRAAVKAAHA